jgi:hypothetical protein
LRVEGRNGKAPEGDKHLVNSSGFCEGDKFLTGSLSDGTAEIAKLATKIKTAWCSRFTEF